LGIALQWWVFGIEQARWIGRVGQRHDSPQSRGAFAQPINGGLQLRRQLRRLLGKRLGVRDRNDLLQRLGGLDEDSGWQTERGQQAPSGVITDPRREGQAQPRCQLLAIHQA
jgi:hypothetical protein